MKRNKVWVNKRSTATHYLDEHDPSYSMCGHIVDLNVDDLKSLTSYQQERLKGLEICDKCQAAVRKRGS